MPPRRAGAASGGGERNAAALAAGFAQLTLDAAAGAATEGQTRRRIAVKAHAPAHVTGAMAGLLAATGFPRAIGFDGGLAVCDPDRFGAERMLRGGADLLVAIEPLRPPPADIAGPSTILIGSRLPPGWPEPAVLLPIVPPVLDGGLWLRSDGVPMTRPVRRRQELDAVLAARPTETDLLHSLLEALA
jgi:hypothetical protein